jgi:hypothetical protein
MRGDNSEKVRKSQEETIQIEQKNSHSDTIAQKYCLN